MTTRITGIIHNLSLGGAEKNFATLFNELSAKGYHCSILCLTPATGHSIEISSKIPVRVLPGYSITKLPTLLKELKAALLSTAPDCIVSFMDQTNILTLLALSKIRKYLS